MFEDEEEAFGGSAAAKQAAALVNGDAGGAAGIDVAPELPDDDYDMFGDDDQPGAGGKGTGE